MYAEQWYDFVFENKSLKPNSSLKTIVESDEEIEFDGIDGRSIVTEPVFVYTHKFKYLNSTNETKEFFIELYKLRNVDEEIQDESEERYFFRMLIEGASDFEIKSFLVPYGTDFDAVDYVVYVRNEPGDWIWRIGEGKYDMPFESIKFEVTFGERVVPPMQDMENEIRRFIWIVLSENSGIGNEKRQAILDLLPGNVNISPNDPHAIVNGSGTLPKVIQKCTKPKKDTCPNAQASLSTQMTASQHQNQLKQKYIVYDTNVWMKSLRLVTSILHDPIKVNYNVYVPYRVGEELDVKKKDPHPGTSAEARRAINAQNNYKKAYPSRIILQTNMENMIALSNHYANHSKADHEILAACLKIRAEGKDVAMCTKDKNLECAAMANNILTYPPITPNMQRKIQESKSFSIFQTS